MNTKEDPKVVLNAGKEIAAVDLLKAVISHYPTVVLKFKSADDVLALYCQCLAATRGLDIGDVVKAGTARGHRTE